MVKVKGMIQVQSVTISSRFNHPMVKVKVDAIRLVAEAGGVSTTLW